MIAVRRHGKGLAVGADPCVSAQRSRVAGECLPAVRDGGRTRGCAPTAQTTDEAGMSLAADTGTLRQVQPKSWEGGCGGRSSAPSRSWRRRHGGAQGTTQIAVVFFGPNPYTFCLSLSMFTFSPDFAPWTL